LSCPPLNGHLLLKNLAVCAAGFFLLSHVIADGVYELLPELSDFHFAKAEYILQFVDGNGRLVGEVF
jgi:hypothetical protein